MICWQLSLVLIGLLGLVVCAEDGVCTDPETCGAQQQQVKVKIAKGANDKGEPPKVVKGQCQDRHPVCVEYAKNGECEINPGWMIVNCPNSCNACHLLDPKVRCDRQRLNISSDPFFAPGDLEKMFQRIVPTFKDRYDIEVLSTSPWVMVFHNFLTDEETAAFIETVQNDWERSTDSGQSNEFGETGRTVSQSRTSSNAWCRRWCEEHPQVQSVIRKIEEVTTIPYAHSESFQILQYQPGQFYRVHHDMAP